MCETCRKKQVVGTVSLDPVLRGTWWGGPASAEEEEGSQWGRILKKPEGSQRAVSGDCGGVRGGLSEPGKVCVDIEATWKLQKGEGYLN